MKKMYLRDYGLFVAILVYAGTAGGQKGAWQEATDEAVQRSKITVPGSTPFHLKASISEINKKTAAYKAEIEEIWVTPNKWRRTIKSAGFSQTLVVNGDKMLEQNTGDYYPFWLRNLVIAIFDVVPEGFTVRKTQVERNADADPRQVPLEGGSAGPGPFASMFSCSRWEEKVGTAPAENSIASAVCFLGHEHLLRGAYTPYFHAQFEDYREFKNKQVPRSISFTPDKDLLVEARISELRDLKNTDEAQFSIEQPTAEKDRARSVLFQEQDALKLLQGPPEIHWSPVRDGKTSGSLSLLVYVDKQGKVREIWPLHSDSPFLQQQAIREVMEWRFKPADQGGGPVQMETLLSFHFQTSLENPLPLLSNSEGRKLAIFKTDPRFKMTGMAKGTEFTIRITLDQQGKLVNIENYHQISPGLFSLAESTVRSWKFKPHKVAGKPEMCNADITFHLD
ncbi:MAG TPA: energy transducer TonB [Candidatus Angelobacter sp.]